MTVDPVTLFRYSALTFNGHRIHYDYPYVTGVEGYPDLVVHGPLIASNLVELCREKQMTGPSPVFIFVPNGHYLRTHHSRLPVD